MVCIPVRQYHTPNAAYAKHSAGFPPDSPLRVWICAARARSQSSTWLSKGAWGATGRAHIYVHNSCACGRPGQGPRRVSLLMYIWPFLFDRCRSSMCCFLAGLRAVPCRVMLKLDIASACPAHECDLLLSTCAQSSVHAGLSSCTSLEVGIQKSARRYSLRLSNGK